MPAPYAKDRPCASVQGGRRKGTAPAGRATCSPMQTRCPTPSSESGVRPPRPGRSGSGCQTPRPCSIQPRRTLLAHGPGRAGSVERAAKPPPAPLPGHAPRGICFWGCAVCFFCKDATLEFVLRKVHAFETSVAQGQVRSVGWGRFLYAVFGCPQTPRQTGRGVWGRNLAKGKGSWAAPTTGPWETRIRESALRPDQSLPGKPGLSNFSGFNLARIFKRTKCSNSWPYCFSVVFFVIISLSSSLPLKAPLSFRDPPPHHVF